MRRSISRDRSKSDGHERDMQNQHAQGNPEPQDPNLGNRKIYATLHGRTIEDDISEYLRGQPVCYRDWREDD